MTTTDRIQLPIPAHALPQRTPRALLDLAHHGLGEAATMRPDGLRYATAHLAALRAAAAVLAARAEPTPGLRRAAPTSVWVLLPQVAPGLSDWAVFFAEGATKRAADSMVRSASDFVAAVETLLEVGR